MNGWRGVSGEVHYSIARPAPLKSHPRLRVWSFETGVSCEIPLDKPGIPNFDFAPGAAEESAATDVDAAVCVCQPARRHQRMDEKREDERLEG